MPHCEDVYFMFCEMEAVHRVESDPIHDCELGEIRNQEVRLALSVSGRDLRFSNKRRLSIATSLTTIDMPGPTFHDSIVETSQVITRLLMVNHRAPTCSKEISAIFRYFVVFSSVRTTSTAGVELHQ